MATTTTNATHEIIDLTIAADEQPESAPSKTTVTHEVKHAEGVVEYTNTGVDSNSNITGNTNVQANVNGNSAVDSTAISNFNSKPSLKISPDEPCLNPNPTSPSTTQNVPDTKVDCEVVEVPKTAAPRRTRKRARKSPVVREEREKSAGGEKSGGEGKEKGEEIDNGKGKGQKKGKQKGEMEMETTGGKRKREVDDEGEEGEVGSEEGETTNENKDEDKHGGEVEVEGDDKMRGVEEQVLGQQESQESRSERERKREPDTPKPPLASLSNNQTKNQNEDQQSRSDSSSASVKPKSKGKTKAEGDERGKMKEPRGKRQYPSSQPQPPSQPAPASEPAPEPEADTSSLFFIDLTPTAIPTVLIDTTPAVALDTSVAPDPVQDTKLLVPAHVTVLGSTPVQIIERRRVGEGQGGGGEDGEAGEEGEEEEEGIEYLDYDDDVRGITRYFDDPVNPDAAAQSRRTVCKNCGAEGEHKTAACPVRICLTCGARDEHSTRSCPITKVCFTCGMKGHINANCPNRRSGRAMMSSRDQECDRCFSSFHKTNECPTWWRIYEYFSEAQQHATLERRLEKKGLLLGKGGEAYIADDEWCYNCGGVGHWGDDCDDARVPPHDHSAFSAYNVMKSPFWDPTSESQHKKSKSATKPRHVDDYVNEQWRGDVLDEVGRKGRVKAQLALQKHEERGEDEDDWFGNRSRSRGAANTNVNAIRDSKSATSSQPPRSTPTEPKKIRFGFSLDAKKKAEQGSLLARLEMPSGNDFVRSEKKDEKRDRDRDRQSGGGRGRGHGGGGGSEKRERGGSDKSSKRDRDTEGKDKSRYKDRDRDRDRRDTWREAGRDEMRSGRRYTGGYAR